MKVNVSNGQLSRCACRATAVIVLMSTIAVVIGILGSGVTNRIEHSPRTADIHEATDAGEAAKSGALGDGSARHSKDGEVPNEQVRVSNPSNNAFGTVGGSGSSSPTGLVQDDYYQDPSYTYRNGVPDWTIDDEFQHDVFTFVRIKYSSWGGRQYHRYGRWATDFPDSELNFSYRLQQLTSITVNPEPIYLELTDERLFDYPFVYMIEPGTLFFSEPEVKALRRYLLNGGFMMVDDFWGSREWDNFYREIQRVFPDREYEELDISHPIFHLVYDLKKKPQIPSIHHWQRYGDTSENGYDSEQVHYRVYKDDNDRICMIICHNTDLGDGWEREGESREYFSLFSEKHAYPLGINIVLYAMTH